MNCSGSVSADPSQTPKAHRSAVNRGSDEHSDLQPLFPLQHFSMRCSLGWLTDAHVLIRKRICVRVRGTVASGLYFPFLHTDPWSALCAAFYPLKVD